MNVCKVNKNHAIEMDDTGKFFCTNCCREINIEMCSKSGNGCIDCHAHSNVISAKNCKHNTTNIE